MGKRARYAQHRVWPGVKFFINELLVLLLFLFFFFLNQRFLIIQGQELVFGLLRKPALLFLFSNCYIWDPNSAPLRVLGGLGGAVCRSLESRLNLMAVWKGKTLFSLSTSISQKAE